MNDKNETQAAQSPAPDTPEKLTPDTSTPDTSTPDTSTPDESAQDFVFLGMPRKEWGPMVSAAYDAEAEARRAEAALPPLVTERDRLLSEVSAAESALSALERENDPVFRRSQDAAAAVPLATTPESLVKAQAALNKANLELQENVRKSGEARVNVERLRQLLSRAQMDLNDAESVARERRRNADGLAEDAKAYEIHDVLEERRFREEEERRKRNFDEQLERRAPYMKARCRDCRFWLPGMASTNKGECHACPPVSSSFPAVLASGWCGRCDPLPDSAPVAGDGVALG